MLSYRELVLLVLLSMGSLGLWACALGPEGISQVPPLPSAALGSELHGKIVDLRRQRFISFDTLTRQLSTAQVIALGEEHYHPDILNFALRLCTTLTEQRSRPLAIALEFLERDMQDDITAYLQAHLDEAALQAQLKASMAFMRLYFPLIRYARQHNLAVLAPNLPRYLARRVAKDGLSPTLDSLSPQERRYLPATPATATARYRDYFLQAIASVHTLHAAAVEPFLAAAHLKDDTMAESLALFLDRTPQGMVLLLAGRFHTDYGIAIPALLHQQRPHLTIQRITAMPVEASSTVELHRLVQDDLADYVWFTTPTPATEQ